MVIWHSWKITILHGKIHYFDWAMFNSYVSHYQSVKPIKFHETTIFPWFSHGFPMVFLWFWAQGEVFPWLLLPLCLPSRPPRALGSGRWGPNPSRLEGVRPGLSMGLRKNGKSSPETIGLFPWRSFWMFLFHFSHQNHSIEFNDGIII